MHVTPTLLSAGNLEEALTHYTAALALDEQPIYLTNRSATFGRLARHEEALTDAEAACSLDPSWTKGYVRKADALARLGRADEGVAALEAGLQAVGDDAVSIERERNERKGRKDGSAV